MENERQVERMLEEYLERYPEERPRLERFERFVRSFSGCDLYDRKNFVGHITAGAFVVDRREGKVLLLEHRQLGRWLQPGGHVEPTDASVFAAALREVREETGLGPDRLEPLRLSPSGGIVPVDADGHYIPACERKAEDEHYHFDLRFAFLFDGDARISIDRSESFGFRWVTLAELGAMSDFGRVARKLDAALALFGIPRGPEISAGNCLRAGVPVPDCGTPDDE